MLPSVETVIIHPHEVVTRIFVRWWIFIGGELCLYFRISFNKLSFASPNRPFLEPVLRLNSVPILSHNRGRDPITLISDNRRFSIPFSVYPLIRFFSLFVRLKIWKLKGNRHGRVPGSISISSVWVIDNEWWRQMKKHLTFMYKNVRRIICSINLQII